MCITLSWKNQWCFRRTDDCAYYTSLLLFSDRTTTTVRVVILANRTTCELFVAVTVRTVRCCPALHPRATHYCVVVRRRESKIDDLTIISSLSVRVRHQIDFSL